MKNVSKAIGGGASGGIGAAVATAIHAQFPEVTVEMAGLIGVIISAALGYFVTYMAPKNRPAR